MTSNIIVYVLVGLMVAAGLVALALDRARPRDTKSSTLKVSEFYSEVEGSTKQLPEVHLDRLIWADYEGFEVQRGLCKTRWKTTTMSQGVTNIRGLWEAYGCLPSKIPPEEPGWYFTMQRTVAGLKLHTSIRYWDGSYWSGPCKPSDDYAARELQLSSKREAELLWFDVDLAISHMLPCGSFRL